MGHTGTYTCTVAWSSCSLTYPLLHRSAPFVFSCFPLFRLFCNIQYNITLVVGILAVGAYACVAGGCVWLYYLTDSITVLTLSLFLPPILYLLVVSWANWEKNDFHTLMSASERKPAAAPFCSAFFRCDLPRRDYLVLFARAAVVLLIVGMGVTIYLASNESFDYVGWIISLSLLVRGMWEEG